MSQRGRPSLASAAAVNQVYAQASGFAPPGGMTSPPNVFSPRTTAGPTAATVQQPRTRSRAAAYYELQSVDEVYQTFLSQPSKKYVPGDLGFDPLDLEAKFPSDLDQRTNEVYNGRLAMLAITGFCVQEGLWGRPVIDLPISGFFFGR